MLEDQQRENVNLQKELDDLKKQLQGINLGGTTANPDPSFQARKNASQLTNNPSVGNGLISGSPDQFSRSQTNILGYNQNNDNSQDDDAFWNQ